METNKEQAKKTVEKLVEQFKEQYASYHKSTYDEATLRIDFINKFFKALGWDVDNADGLAEDYREVITEDKVKIGKKTKAPDYGFRLSGSDKRLFFVEAKKPSVNIKVDKAAAHQLRRYGRSAQTPVSILTNFEDFVVYDCSRTPSANDSAAVNRIKSLGYEDYIAQFDFIYDTFSREAVVKGRFDKFVQSDANKRGSVPLDREFVEVLNDWRKQLAVSIARNNRHFNEEQINYAVQQTIDRLIFLRFCEDRAVEHYENLKNTTAKGDTYQNLLHVFAEADAKYNSGLFDFEKDTITKYLKVDNKIIKNIVLELYAPKCEYEFSVMPVEILGNAYEQFLGKVIRITANHSARIDDKPEVRKAGGVYYTPQYIVDYIVEHTVGELIRGKGPKEIEKIKIVDPACGSGSFLLGAFKYLLKHYTDWYIANGYMEKKNGGGKLTATGRLVTAEKRKILLTHIYGVDLDANAVEVSKLSLLLRCMEGETAASINQQLTLHHERILPDLDKNIKDGNSLIDTDFYDNEMDFGYERRIKPFNWKKAFPDVFKPRKDIGNESFKSQFNLVKQQHDLAKENAEKLIEKYQGKLEEPLIEYGSNSGFDVIIGNPPYGALLSQEEDTYLRSKYDVANYQLDTYNLFVERATQISRYNARFGFIIPSAWTGSVYDDKFRRFLTNEIQINEIVITPKQTFKDATVETCILLFRSDEPLKQFVITRWDKGNIDSYPLTVKTIKRTPDYSFPIYSNPVSLNIIETVRNCPTLLSDFAEVVWGVKVYKRGMGTPRQKGSESEKKIFHSDAKTKSSHRPLIGGSEITRYCLNWNGGYLDYGKWLAEPRKPEWFEGERLLVREVTANGIIQATFVDGDYVFSNSVDGIKLINDSIELKYLLGIINSKLLSFYHTNTSPNAFKGTFPKVLLKDLRELPIPESTEKLRKVITNHVDLLLGFQKELQSANLESVRDHIQQKIAHSERKIDELVYQLYGLTDEEIRIVEGG